MLVVDGPSGVFYRDVNGARAYPPLRGRSGTGFRGGHRPLRYRSYRRRQGSGSFTGVRVAVTAAKVLAAALEAPLVAPDSLTVTAMGVGEHGDAVFAAIDARRGEVYHALYRQDRGYPVALMEPRVAPPEAAAASVRDWMEKEGSEVAGVGNGMEAYPGAWPAGLTRSGTATPRAESLAGICRLAYACGETEDPVALLPFYLRRPDARERGGREEEGRGCSP